MTTPLVLKLFCLNEKIDTLVLRFSFANRRLTWDTELFEWRLETNQKKLYFHYIILYVYGLLFNLVFANVLTVLHLWVLEPDILSLSTEYIVVFVFMLIFSCLVVIFDLLICVYGEECVNLCNFLQTRESQLNNVYINAEYIRQASFTSGIISIALNLYPVFFD